MDTGRNFNWEISRAMRELRKDAFQRLVPSIQTDETSSRSNNSLPPELTVVHLQQTWIENKQ